MPSKSLQFVETLIPIQTLIKMGMVVIEDYYHTTTMDEKCELDKQTYILSKFPLNFRAPFLYVYLH